MSQGPCYVASVTPAASSRSVLEGEDLLVLADDVWRAPKRTRHKIPLAWARAGNRVLWVETPYPTERERGPSGSLQAVAPGLFVYTPPLAMPLTSARRRPWTRAVTAAAKAAYIFGVRRALEQVDLRPDWTVVWQEPRLAFALGRLAPAGRIYYGSDLFTDVSGRGRESELLRRCLDRVNAAFATSEKIADGLRALHPEVHVMPHAADPDWWSTADRSEPADLAPIPHPRVLFVGVGTIKFDLELWNDLARRRPEWQLVTIGPFHDAIRDRPTYREAEQRPNVHFLGERPFEALPAYLAHADVLACPYRQDPVRTASGLPHKFYEYALAGHPILSTPFTELEASLPQLTVAPGGRWAELEIGELPRGDGVVTGQTYTDRIEHQRRVLARLRRAT